MAGRDPAREHPRGPVAAAFRAGPGRAAACGASLLALAVAGRPALPAVVALVALYTFTRGLVVPAATAAAMEPMGHAAGLASGLLGALQMAGAALAASGVGLFGDPLVGVGATLALFGAAALACGLGAEGGFGRCAPAAEAPGRR